MSIPILFKVEHTVLDQLLHSSLTPKDFDCLMESFAETIARSTSCCHSKPAFEELGKLFQSDLAIFECFLEE